MEHEPKKVIKPLYYDKHNKVSKYSSDKDKVISQIPEVVNQHAELLTDLDARIKKLETELFIKEEQIEQEREIHRASMAIIDRFYKDGIIEDLKRRIKELEAERKAEAQFIAQQLEAPKVSKSI